MKAESPPRCPAGIRVTVKLQRVEVVSDFKCMRSTDRWTKRQDAKLKMANLMIPRVSSGVTRMDIRGTAQAE